MPVAGVTDPSASQLKFEWTNIRLFYSIFMTICFTALAAICFIWVLVNDISLPIIGKINQFHYKLRLKILISSIFLEPFVWFVMKIIGNVCFIKLGKRWPELMLRWEMVERKSSSYGNEKRNYVFYKNIRIIAVILVIIIHSTN